MNLNDAYICLDCDEIIDVTQLIYKNDWVACPKCTNNVCQPLSKWVTPLHIREMEYHKNIKIKDFLSLSSWGKNS